MFLYWYTQYMTELNKNKCRRNKQYNKRQSPWLKQSREHERSTRTKIIIALAKTNVLSIAPMCILLHVLPTSMIVLIIYPGLILLLNSKAWLYASSSTRNINLEVSFNYSFKYIDDVLLHKNPDFDKYLIIYWPHI